MKSNETMVDVDEGGDKADVAAADETKQDDAPIEDENDNTLDEDEEDNEAEKTNEDDDGDENDEAEDEDMEEDEEIIKEDYKDEPSNNEPSETKKRPAELLSSSDAPSPSNDNKVDDDTPLPTLPLKKARTAYFIFAQDKREELKQKYQGEGVAAISKATGALWAALEPSDKEGYENQAAQERERYMKDKQRLIDAGRWPDSNDMSSSGGGAAGDTYDEDAIIFPIGRIRKICKLDGDVKGMSKEATMLVAKATELFAAKLGSEVVTMAQMSNRRKLLPDDVVEVCSVKERFMFLKDDLNDLRNEQRDIEKEKENEKAASSSGGKGGESDKSDGGASKGTSSLFAYFGKVH